MGQHQSHYLGELVEKLSPKIVEELISRFDTPYANMIEFLRVTTAAEGLDDLPKTLIAEYVGVKGSILASASKRLVGHYKNPIANPLTLSQKDQPNEVENRDVIEHREANIIQSFIQRHPPRGEGGGGLWVDLQDAVLDNPGCHCPMM